MRNRSEKLPSDIDDDGIKYLILRHRHRRHSFTVIEYWHGLTPAQQHAINALSTDERTQWAEKLSNAAYAG